MPGINSFLTQYWISHYYGVFGLVLQDRTRLNHTYNYHRYIIRVLSNIFGQKYGSVTLNHQRSETLTSNGTVTAGFHFKIDWSVETYPIVDWIIIRESYLQNVTFILYRYGGIWNPSGKIIIISHAWDPTYVMFSWNMAFRTGYWYGYDIKQQQRSTMLSH